MPLVPLRLTLSAEVIAAGNAPDRLFQLALGLISDTHVHPASLLRLAGTEYPRGEHSNQSAPASARKSQMRQRPNLDVSAGTRDRGSRRQPSAARPHPSD